MLQNPIFNLNAFYIYLSYIEDIHIRRQIFSQIIIITPDEYLEVGVFIITVYVIDLNEKNGKVDYSFAVLQQFGPVRGEHF